MLGLLEGLGLRFGLAAGVLLLGKTPAAAARLSGSFAKRKAQKTYWAIVAGNPHPTEGVMELHLAKRGVGDRELVVPAQPKDPDAQPAETEFVTISRAGPRASRMALRPHTGRTHQLRAHMKAMGHPILGDALYAPPEVQAMASRLLLHACRLAFAHPADGTPQVFEDTAPF